MTVRELYSLLKERLAQGGVDSADFEARVIICELLGYSLTDLFLKFNEPAGADITDRAAEMCERRLTGEPLQYILGKWDFMGRSYFVGPGVLIPRPETELLCEKVTQALKGKEQAVVYDLCSGSGCIGITIKKEYPDAELYLVEKSEKALGYLMKNTAEHLKGSFYSIIRGDVLRPDLFKEYPDADLIVSNPPYIRSSEVPLLQREVGFEPVMALDGGEDGLDFYRVIIKKWSEKLKPDGEMFFETGEEQGPDVCAMFDEVGFDSRIINDYNNLNRIVKGRKVPYNDI